MKYSRNQINKAGQQLIGADPFLRSEAKRLVTDWRETFIPVLDRFNVALNEYFGNNNISYEFSANRIKRMFSIVNKLQHNPEMGLGGIQDMGGVRFVFKDMDCLMKAKTALESFKPIGFQLEKQNDYIKSPKQSGYRSIHYIYKYSCDNKNYDGLRIELQIRTRLEHSWAMAVETASLITNSSLKTNIDDNQDWRSFFKLVSAIFADKENTPRLQQFAELSNQNLCKQFFVFQNRNFISQFQALRVTISQPIPKDKKQGYYVLTINFKEKKVFFQIYDNHELACKSFKDIESNLTPDDASLMVSIENIKEIIEAYPSYFLDTREFIKVIEEFAKYCKVNFPKSVNN